MKSKLQRGEGEKNETTDHCEHLLILDLALCSPLNRLLTAGNQAHQVKQTQKQAKYFNSCGYSIDIWDTKL